MGEIKIEINDVNYMTELVENLTNEQLKIVLDSGEKELLVISFEFR